METELLSLRELARRTGKDVDTVRRWRDQEGLPVYSLGPRRQAVLWAEFMTWLQSRRLQDRTRSAMH
jgi:hypothetical protein